MDGNNRIWLQDIETHNLKQIIKVPTTETDLSSTLIDHIYTNNDGRIFNIDVPKIRLSDHYPIYFTWKHAASHRPTSKKYRATDKLNVNAFKHDLYGTVHGRMCCRKQIQIGRLRIG